MSDAETPETAGSQDAGPQDAGPQDGGEARELPSPTLQMHVFHMASQVSMALGEVENPLTNEKQVDLQAARFLIDTIAMLEEKTRGNRSDDEEQYVTGVLANLRMAYVRKSGP